MSALLNRKGAVRVADIPVQVLAALNAGEVATVNLVEFLAIDLAQLATHVARHMGLDPKAERLQDTLATLHSFKPMQRHGHIARALYDLTTAHPQRDLVANALATHSSDIARSWASHWLTCSNQSLAEKLLAVRPFAADSHFGVREMAWMSVRNDVIADLDNALLLLQPWVTDEDANIRRFACELTRPRGVWCAQIEVLKAQPWKAQELLDPLRSDPSRYVQNSLANWLNDASKSQPKWVEKLCTQWLAQRQGSVAGKATDYIVRRARRTLDKDESQA